MTDDSSNSDGTAFEDPGVPCEVTRSIDDESPSRVVVRAVASLSNVPVTELRPLYEVVDPEHLDGVCRSPADADHSCAVSFEYAGCTVTVSGEAVRVRLLETPAE